MMNKRKGSRNLSLPSLQTTEPAGAQDQGPEELTCQHKDVDQTIYVPPRSTLLHWKILMMCDSSARLTFALPSSSDREKTSEWVRREKTRLWKVIDVHFYQSASTKLTKQSNRRLLWLTWGQRSPSHWISTSGRLGFFSVHIAGLQVETKVCR